MLLKLFLTFFKIGILTFGGGHAMLPMIHQEVLKNSWLTTEELINFIAVSESTPGPFAINISTYVGSITAGFPGAVAATFGVVLPSFIVILIVARMYERFNRSRYVRGVLSGIKPAVVGLIASAVISVARSVFLYEGVFAPAEAAVTSVIFLLGSYLLIKKKTHPIMVVILSAVIGIVCGMIGLFE